MRDSNKLNNHYEIKINLTRKEKKYDEIDNVV